MNILDLIFPKHCVGCGRLGQYICSKCRRSIRVVEQNESICSVCEGPAVDGATHPRCRSRFALDGLTCFFHYDGVIRKAIKSIKYRHVSDLVTEFTSLVPASHFSHITRMVGDKAVIFIPVPLHATRLRSRGYNQAEVLGKELAKSLHLSMHIDILYRSLHTTAQVDMKSRVERLGNMNHAFTARDVDIKDAVIVLFDDVFTTGATMRSAANVLKRKGAKYVWAVTMAR